MKEMTTKYAKYERKKMKRITFTFFSFFSFFLSSFLPFFLISFVLFSFPQTHSSLFSPLTHKNANPFPYFDGGFLQPKGGMQECGCQEGAWATWCMQAGKGAGCWSGAWPCDGVLGWCSWVVPSMQVKAGMRGWCSCKVRKRAGLVQLGCARRAGEGWHARLVQLQGEQACNAGDAWLLAGCLDEQADRLCMAWAWVLGSLLACTASELASGCRSNLKQQGKATWCVRRRAGRWLSKCMAIARSLRAVWLMQVGRAWHVLSGAGPLQAKGMGALGVGRQTWVKAIGMGALAWPLRAKGIGSHATGEAMPGGSCGVKARRGWCSALHGCAWQHGLVHGLRADRVQESFW